MIKFIYTTRCKALALILPLLLAMAPAMAQTVVYLGDTTPLAVTPVSGDTYQWELYSNGTVNFATTAGNCPVTSAAFVGVNTGPSVGVKWLKTGTYFFKVTARDATNCTNNFKIGMVIVKESLPTSNISPPDPICVGVTAVLTVNLTGTAPWDVTFTDGVNSWTVTGIVTTPYKLIVSPKITTNYWITQVRDQSGINSIPSAHVVLQVNPKPWISKIYIYQP